jgi:hypothetical protein
VAGFQELVDMTDVDRIVLIAAERVRQLAALSADMDVCTPATKFAIVAPQDFEFGLGRMYAAYRELDCKSTKEVQVFRTIKEALEWLR